MSWTERTALLLGSDGVEKLKNASVAVFGIGGVGSFAAEALARAGVGRIALFDKDVVSQTNRNRQLVALTSTVGRPKAEVMRERILDINPEAEVCTHTVFYLPENAGEYDLSAYDYIVDAVDNVSAKIELAVRAEKCGTKLISSMGAGNKLDPTRFRVSDIYRTQVCPLARVMRGALKKRGVKKLKVVYSDEVPVKAQAPVGSVSFVPSVVGLICAGEVIKEITGGSN